eukprot:sb/3470524/
MSSYLTDNFLSSVITEVREEYVDGKKRTIRRCKICQRDYKGTASVNSNFITHLKTPSVNLPPLSQHVHPELLHDWARKKAERAEKATSFLSRHQGTTMLPTSYGRNYLSSITSQTPCASEVVLYGAQVVKPPLLYLFSSEAMGHGGQRLLKRIQLLILFLSHYLSLYLSLSLSLPLSLTLSPPLSLTHTLSLSLSLTLSLQTN